MYTLHDDKESIFKTSPILPGQHGSINIEHSDLLLGFSETADDGAAMAARP